MITIVLTEEEIKHAEAVVRPPITPVQLVEVEPTLAIAAAVYLETPSLAPLRYSCPHQAPLLDFPSLILSMRCFLRICRLIIWRT